MTRPNTEKDFHRRYQIMTSGCWEWQGGNKEEYGKFPINGKIYLAHRYSYITYKGVITNKMHVCHHCDNVRCVNPEHLFLGTNQDNMQDASQKGRLQKRSNRIKLNKKTVIEIRNNTAETIIAIAKKYNIDKTTVFRVKKRMTWKNIADNNPTAQKNTETANTQKDKTSTYERLFQEE